MKTRLLVMMVMILLLGASSTRAYVPAQPNILLLMPDDGSQRGFGCYGQTLYQTPNIDALAASGMRFTQAYTGSTPLCSPSRWTLFNGRPGILNGVRTNLGDPPDSEVTIAEALPPEYATGLIGQWNQLVTPWGVPPFSSPASQGFDFFFGTFTVQEKSQSWPVQLWDNGVWVPNTQYVTDRYTDVAIDFISQHTTTGQPWFLTVAYNAPHSPDPVPDDGQTPTFAGQFDGSAARQRYAASFARLDHQIGRLINSLPDPANTWVFLVGDHSDFSDGSGPNVEPANYFQVNLPYRGGGGIRPQYEGAIRIPWIVRGPNVQAGLNATATISGADLFPTIMSIVGGTIDPAWGVTGRNQLSVLQGGPPLPELAMCWEANCFQYQAIREGNWKLLLNGSTSLLYNLATDLGETNNLAASQQTIVNNLKAKLTTWRLTRSLRVPDSLAVSTINGYTDRLRLTWRHNSGADEKNFRVERSLNGTSFTQIASLAAGVYSYTSTGLTDNTTYWYRVRAVDTVGYSDYSNIVSGTP